MIRGKFSTRTLDKKLRSKNLVTLIVLFILVALFYGLAVVRLQTSLAL